MQADLPKRTGSPLRWVLLPVTEFASVATAWDAINQQFSQSPLLDYDFVRISLAHFGDGNELVAACYRDDDMVAAGVMARTGTLHWQCFQAAQAPMGAWVQLPDLSLESLLASLLKALPSPAPMVALTQLDPDFVARPPAASPLKTLDYIQTSRITAEGTFDDYWQARGKNLKQNLRRQRNRLAREKVETTLEIVADGTHSAAMVDDFGLLESAGWKQAAGTAVHPDNVQGRFYRDLMQHYFDRKEALIYRYLYGDKLVATDLCLHRDGVLILLKTTYDETQKTTSPTMLMRYDVFEDMFENATFKRVEFYGPVMGWHRKWTDEIRTMYHVNYYGSGVLRFVVGLRERIRNRIGKKSADKPHH